jgi:hypothetical protein
MKQPVLIGTILVLLLAGTATGYGLSKLIPKTPKSSADSIGAPGTITSSEIEVGKVYGVEDAKKFADTSEGIIEPGGIDGEGSHHLIRPGGKTQTVYLTSSVVDLDLFNGHKVQIKGQTFSAQKASWFMDVGNVKVVELNAQKPAGSE